MLRHRPDVIDLTIEQINVLKDRGENFTSDLPQYLALLKDYAEVLERIDNAETTDQLLECEKALYAYKNSELDMLGVFESSFVYCLCSEKNEVREKLIDMDFTTYPQRFNTPLAMDVARSFFEIQTKNALGRPSFQGTLAASEMLTSEPFRSFLQGELNIVYPGSGGHMTPLVMAFDLIDRGVIQTANILLNDRRDCSKIVYDFLLFLQRKKTITEVVVQTNVDRKNVQYHFMYHGKRVVVEVLVEDATKVLNWDTNGKPFNVIYDHIPFSRALPGSAINVLRSGAEEEGGKVMGSKIVISPGDGSGIRSSVNGENILSLQSRKGVAFADKNAWCPNEKGGMGVSVALVSSIDA